MNCKCDRVHVTPHSWYSRDGKTKFMMDQHGMTDILPVSKLETFLHSTSKFDKVKVQYNHPNYIHWAF